MAAFSVLLAASSARAGVVESTFDTDADGWTLFQNAGAPFGWIAAGGNPNGHIGATDKTNDWAYVQAPSKFLVPAEYDGTFSFDLRLDNLQQPVGFPGIFNVRVGLEGAGLILINEGALPTTSWQTYSFALNAPAAGWRKFSGFSQNYSGAAPLATEQELRDVLAGLTRLIIATDYTLASIDSNVPQIDRTYLDNVRLSTVSPAIAAVPEPASLAIWGIGAVGMVFAARRRRRAAPAAAA